VPEESGPATGDTGFELYQERHQGGLISRFFATFWQFLGLIFGGGIAFVRQKKEEHEAGKFWIVMLRFGLFFVRPFLDKKIIAQPFPIQFRMRLERLGSTYIKLGQILSLREDLLPKSITEELKMLLDRLPAVSYERLKEIVEEELGRPLGERFVWIDPVPLGSASLAQTHRARLVTHEKVVIKVLKPGVRRSVETDTRLLRLFGRFWQLFLARYQPRRIIDEFCAYTLREVDLRFEAENAETFAANFKDEPDIRFPKIYPLYSSREVLCMQYFKGVRPDAKTAAKLTEEQRKKIIDLGISAIVNMIFRDGFFHADLHPGNLLVFKDASVGFIDLGMVGRFDADIRKQLFYYFYSLVMGDASDAARHLSTLALPGKGMDIEGFRRAAAGLYDRWLRNPNFNEFSLAQVILQSILMAGHYRIQYPGEIILMVKALVTVEGVGNLLDPGINVVSAARRHVQRILISQLNPITVARDMVLVFPEMVDLIKKSPAILGEGLQMLENNMKKPPPGRLSDIRSTLLAGFCLLAGTIVLTFQGPWPVTAVLFFLAFILALRK
jgi:ubiquinone biosynthesis protein